MRVTKFVKMAKLYIFTVKQGKDKTHEDYIARFKKEPLYIEDCSDDLMLNAMMVGLKPSKLLWSLGKNYPKNFRN